MPEYVERTDAHDPDQTDWPPERLLNRLTELGELERGIKETAVRIGNELVSACTECKSSPCQLDPGSGILALSGRGDLLAGFVCESNVCQLPEEGLRIRKGEIESEGDATAVAILLSERPGFFSRVLTRLRSISRGN